ncbi:MAG TPA: DNA alkylation repair protein, partial [Bryobacteraceae bacterium]|nr:DNA alkylation repair protein [Bryobacteraceae bacterium]
MTVRELVRTTRMQLKAAAEPGFRAQLQWFFKEPVDPYGVRGKKIHEIGRSVYRELKNWPPSQRDTFMDELWKSGKLEEGALVCSVYRRFSKQCDEREFAMFERWIDRYVTNWANADGVASWLLAASIANRPALIAKLAKWTKSKNRWKRRAAVVSLLQEAKKGRNTESIFEICELLREDQDVMVQKGVGWVLKETYPRRTLEVLRFLESWRATAPRLVLRYAAEKMSAQDKKW